jgi:hypothetical protein
MYGTASVWGSLHVVLPLQNSGDGRICNEKEETNERSNSKVEKKERRENAQK